MRRLSFAESNLKCDLFDSQWFTNPAEGEESLDKGVPGAALKKFLTQRRKGAKTRPPEPEGFSFAPLREKSYLCPTDRGSGGLFARLHVLTEKCNDVFGGGSRQKNFGNALLF